MNQPLTNRRFSLAASFGSEAGGAFAALIAAILSFCAHGCCGSSGLPSESQAPRSESASNALVTMLWCAWHSDCRLVASRRRCGAFATGTT